MTSPAPSDPDLITIPSEFAETYLAIERGEVPAWSDIVALWRVVRAQAPEVFDAHYVRVFRPMLFKLDRKTTNEIELKLIEFRRRNPKLWRTLKNVHPDHLDAFRQQLLDANPSYVDQPYGDPDHPLYEDVFGVDLLRWKWRDILAIVREPAEAKPEPSRTVSEPQACVEASAELAPPSSTSENAPAVTAEPPGGDLFDPHVGGDNVLPFKRPKPEPDPVRFEPWGKCFHNGSVITGGRHYIGGDPWPGTYGE
jgi:hypothetical protein